MEKYQELRGEARQKLRNADHLLTMTYPAVRENKLLLAAAENLNDALTASLLSVLYHERLARRIPPFHEDLESALRAFTEGVMSRYPIDRKYIKLIADMDELVRMHKASPVEFSRKDTYVIASGNYELRELTHGMLKGCLEDAKRFIQDMEIIASKDEPFSRRSG